MNIDSKAILAEVRRAKAAKAACAGHVFSRKPEAAIRGWKCDRCNEQFDAHEIHMYRQGLEHAAKGHTAEAVLPKEWTP